MYLIREFAEVGEEDDLIYVVREKQIQEAFSSIGVTSRCVKTVQNPLIGFSKNSYKIEKLYYYLKNV